MTFDITHNPDFSLLTVQLEQGQKIFAEPAAMASMDSTIKLTALALSAALLGTGCGATCQSTCNRLYQEAGGSCNIQSPGAKQVELLTLCMDECEDALAIAGEARSDYTPDKYTPSDKSIVFKNDKEVALWMDCVANTSCDFLDSGYCAPVW